MCNYNYNKLIGRIIEKFGSRKSFAKAIGISETSMSKKLAGAISITTQDIERWIQPDLLDIPPAEIPEYFFKKKEDDE